MDGVSCFSFDETKSMLISNSFSKIYINGTGNVKWTLFDESLRMCAFGDDNQVEVGILKDGVYKLLITYDNGSQKVLNVRKVII